MGDNVLSAEDRAEYLQRFKEQLDAITEDTAKLDFVAREVRLMLDPSGSFWSGLTANTEKRAFFATFHRLARNCIDREVFLLLKTEEQKYTDTPRSPVTLGAQVTK